ncbi:hypothetical protein [Flavobacterium sp.]|uniref:hypothetical protein n=1 Tax=Flavobacterium sp. TaxID=239 RepID=UPI0026356353|nr:hypothetical protein [Flavobacterium sp.]
MRTINKIIIIALSLFAFSCEDILEEDITNDIVQVIAPTSGDVITSNVVDFQWNQLKGADKYRVQVYNSSQAIVLDSVVSNKTSLIAPISAGEYQWRVRGENAGYVSTYSFPESFSVVESLDLTNQQVLLSNPANNIYTRSTTLSCSWQTLNPADYYELELVNVTAGQTIVHQESDITGTSFLLNSTLLAQDAQYEWKVKGVNATSETAFSSRTFYVDRVAPSASENSLPIDNSVQVAGQPIRFTWTVPTDTGTIQSPVTYSIEFSNTVGFNTILRTSSSAIAQIDETFTASGDYYWRVKTTDKALNTSIYSTPIKFKIN